MGGGEKVELGILLASIPLVFCVGKFDRMASDSLFQQK
jgi:hypothetical protein